MPTTLLACHGYISASEKEGSAANRTLTDLWGPVSGLPTTQQPRVWESMAGIATYYKPTKIRGKRVVYR